jgi:hypothetical protein
MRLQQGQKTPRESRQEGGPPVRGRGRIWTLLALAALLASLVGAEGSTAALRTYENRMTQLNGPSSVAFDAQGRVWATDLGQGKNPPGIQGIYLFDAYPSQTIISEPNTFEPWEYASRQLQVAVNKETDEVVFAMSNPRRVDFFDELGVYDHSGTALNGFKGGTPIHIAIDNSSGTSRGRFYLSLTSPENAIEVFDDQQRPVDFPATADYIEGNTLTGTPAGPFGAIYFVTVDEQGSLFVTDAAKNVVDQFSWTGEWVRSFPAPRATFFEGINGIGGVAVDPTNGNVAIAEGTWDGFEGGITEFDRWGNFLGRLTDDPNPGLISPNGTPAVDASGRLHVPAGNDYVTIFGAAPPLPTATYEPVTGETTQAGTVHAEVDSNGGGNITECHFEYGTNTSYGLGTIPCTPDPASAPPGSNFSAPTDVSANLSGLTTGTTYHYRVVATNSNGEGYGSDRTYTPQAAVGLRTEAATEVEERSATLNASVIGDGTPLAYEFEWGPTSAYGSSTASTSAGSPGGPGRTPLGVAIDSLEPYTTYHYRVVTSGGGAGNGEDKVFTTPPGIPTIGAQRVSEVHSDRAIMHGEVNPNGAVTTYHFEYIDDQSFQQTGFAGAAKAPAGEIRVGMSKTFQQAEVSVDGLKPGTTYHYRLVGTNSAGVGVPSVDKTFNTYKFGFDDKCPNAHVRQQTGSALLLDCRAYELASAANAGGYDAESDLVAGQEPFDQLPYARTSSQVLYGVHEGGIPGTGRPTNRGLDPYVAVRGETGWATRYVGISADNPFAGKPFGSPLLESDAMLSTFAFGGEGICDPCFEDGSSGEPVRLADGTFVQGMQGSLDPGPAAEPSGFVGRHLSADGTHYVFGSTAKFEPDGNSNGDVSIYVRDLESEETRVVSKTPGGVTMTGPGIGQLDISTDGERVVVGRQVSTDSAGNRYWHLYMNVGGAGHSIDLMPTATEGALYSGMSADGTEVYLSSKEGLAVGDEDSSIDIYRADVGADDSTMTRVSTGDGGAGNTDSCDPSANTVHARWNSLGAGANCNALAVGGGGGVPAESGGIYFLSPESLDADATDPQPLPDAPNLYLSTPGEAPVFVRTLESSATAPIPPPSHPYLRSFGAFGNPAGAAIDPVTRDVYVFDIGTEFEAPGYVLKYDSEGNSSLGFGTNGKIALSGIYGVFNLPVGIAVDTAPSSPNYRNLFVPTILGGAIRMYDPQGNLLSSIEAPGPSSVAIDSATGEIYVASYFAGVFKYSPSGTPLGFFPTIAQPTDLAVHDGKVYVVNGGGFGGAAGTAHVYDTSGADLGELDSGPARGVAVDPSDGHVFVDKGDRVVEYDAAGNPLPVHIGVGLLSSSFDLAADAGSLVITNRGSGNVATYGPLVTEPDPAVDNQLVIHSLDSASTRFPGDFQVTPSGEFAVLGSTLPLTGYDNGGHSEVFRYDSRNGNVDCTSCNPTGEQATGDATLAARGLSVTDDGRVFFNSTEGLVDRDLNEQRDAYQWKQGEGIELISTGAATLGASLLGVSADGLDAFFFTREKLVSSDENGSRVKLYDARSFGGYPYVPPPVPCKAADECRGPGSAKPPAPIIGSVTGTPVGNARPPAKKCKAGKKKKKKCGRNGKRRKQKKSRRGNRR